MKKDMLDTLAAMGDRSTRETAVLLDLIAAGAIDQLRGSGTIRLMPARLEELVDRIAPRRRDPDGAWLVTLLPPEDDNVAVSPAMVLAYVHETEPADPETEDMDIAELVRAAAVPGVTLRDLGMQGFAYFVEWCGERYAAVDNQPG